MQHVELRTQNKLERVTVSSQRQRGLLLLQGEQPRSLLLSSSKQRELQTDKEWVDLGS